MTEGITELYYRTLRLLNVKANRNETAKFCEKYRFEPFNFFAFIGDLTIWNIAHVFSSIDTVIRQAHFPFPAVLKVRDKHRYVLLTGIQDSNYHIYDPFRRKNEVLVKDQLKTQFEPIVLLLQSVSQEIKYSGNRLVTLVSKITFLLFFCTLVGLGFVIEGIYAAGFYYLSLVGLLLCYLITIGKFGGAKIIDRFCESDNIKSNCKNVTQSDYSQLFGLIPLEYLGVFYFSNSCIYPLLSSLNTPASLNFIFFITHIPALCTMLILFGIQIFRIRKYCPLCIATLVVVIGMNTLSLFYINHFSFHGVALFGISLIIALNITMMFRGAVRGTWGYEYLELANNRFLNNTDVFRSLEKTASKTLPSLTEEFLINPRPGAKVIHLFLKDDCAFCEPMLKEVLNLLKLTHQYSLSLKLDCAEMKTEEVWAVIKKKLFGLTTHFDEEFDISIINQDTAVFSGSLTEIDHRQHLLDLAKIALCNNTSIEKFPSVFLERKKIHEIYDGARLKRHLILAQYE